MNSRSWDEKVKRAEKLIASYPFSHEPLSFYHEVLLFQKDLYRSLSQEIESDIGQEKRGCSFEGSSIDLSMPFLASFFPSFLSLIDRIGSQDLSHVAARLLVASQEEWEKLLKLYWRRKLAPKDFQEGPVLLFFPKAFLQPYAEALANKYPQEFSDDSEEWLVRQGGKADCPRCGRQPQLGILRTEGEGASRSLLCCLCATEWRYKRLSCPSCGEENFSKLSYHKASDFPHVRLEVCESCKKYIKSIDLTVNGRAVPVVDEIATLPLDLWAMEQGYSKIEINLIGL